jgi:WD40-like Beta Propeller Repeat
MRIAAEGLVVLGAAVSLAAQALPEGATTIVNQDRFGGQLAICAETGEQAVQQGARKIVQTGVWVGEAGKLQRLHAGMGACDPAWSPDGRRLAITDVDGLWVFPARSIDGILRVEAKLPLGEPTEFTYRAFSHPEWSPDGLLLALVVSNGGTSWVEVFDVASGRLFYTSPPAQSSFSWGSNARLLKMDTLEIQLPLR